MTHGGPTLTNTQLRATPVDVLLTSTTVSTLKDPHIEISRGNVSSYTLLTKFGANRAVGTSLTPICISGVYQTPTAATALEFVSSDANDTAAGTGAREVTVVGLNSSWAEVSQTVTTNGTTPVALGTNLIRLYRWYVSSSGTYATTAAGSHAGTLTIRVSGAGATWSQIPITPLAIGENQTAAYTVPTGKTAYLISVHAYEDASKAADLYLFQRPAADDVSSPYSGALKLVAEYPALTGEVSRAFNYPKGPFVGPCDLIFMGKVASGTGTICAEFDLILLDT